MEDLEERFQVSEAQAFTGRLVSEVSGFVASTTLDARVSIHWPSVVDDMDSITSTASEEAVDLTASDFRRDPVGSTDSVSPHDLIEFEQDFAVLVHSRLTISDQTDYIQVSARSDQPAGSPRPDDSLRLRQACV